MLGKEGDKEIIYKKMTETVKQYKGGFYERFFNET